MKIIIISGYFNPVHSGHMDYIKSAKKLGDYLIVIVNNDIQRKLKGSQPFMNEQERMEIVKALKCVDEVVLSKDKDRTVCYTLEVIKSVYWTDELIFANGGDRDSRASIPEDQICDQIGCEMVFGVGRDKVWSSSDFLGDWVKFKAEESSQ